MDDFALTMMLLPYYITSVGHPAERLVPFDIGYKIYNNTSTLRVHHDNLRETHSSTAQSLSRQDGGQNLSPFAIICLFLFLVRPKTPSTSLTSTYSRWKRLTSALHTCGAGIAKRDHAVPFQRSAGSSLRYPV
jgi:hypothetical protein